MNRPSFKRTPRSRDLETTNDPGSAVWRVPDIIAEQRAGELQWMRICLPTTPVSGCPHLLFFLGFLLAGLLYDSPWFEGQLAGIGVTTAGGILAALGLALVLISSLRHKKAGSNIEPWKPTTTIITTGVYGYSRNPIYLGMVLTHAGLSICGGSLAALASLALSVLVIRIYVIAREERYLEAKFGKDYRDYKERVRRWI